eukprot:630467_1
MCFPLNIQFAIVKSQTQVNTCTVTIKNNKSNQDCDCTLNATNVPPQNMATPNRCNASPFVPLFHVPDRVCSLPSHGHMTNIHRPHIEVNKTVFTTLNPHELIFNNVAFMAIALTGYTVADAVLSALDPAKPIIFDM